MAGLNPALVVGCCLEWQGFIAVIVGNCAVMLSHRWKYPNIFRCDTCNRRVAHVQQDWCKHPVHDHSPVALNTALHTKPITSTSYLSRSIATHHLRCFVIYRLHSHCMADSCSPTQRHNLQQRDNLLRGCKCWCHLVYVPTGL